MDHPVVTQRNSLAVRVLDLELVIIDRDAKIAELEKKVSELEERLRVELEGVE